VQASAVFEESLALCRELGDLKAAARALSNLASVVRLQGDYARARSLYEECAARFADLGDRAGMAWSLDYQGDVAREQGEMETARALYSKSLAEFRALGGPWGIAGTLADLGNLALDNDDHAGASANYGESLQIFKELGSKRGVARLLECFAYAAAAEGHPERALRLAGAAAALRQSVGAPPNSAERIRLEKCLVAARVAVSTTAGSAAWMEGFAMPAEKAIAHALSPE
jgi:adenylate cyclase